MHSAPAVSYPVGRCRFQGFVLAGLLVTGACALVAWAVQSEASAARQLGAALLWLLCALIAVRSWLRSPSGLLTWDGQLWHWAGSGEPHPVALCMTFDSQTTLLLHLQAAHAPSIWVWLEQRAAPLRWLACRRAVFGPKPPATAADSAGVAP